MIILDAEIANPIPPDDDGERIEGIQYAKGWKFPGTMGLACVCIYKYPTDSFHLFGEYEIDELQQMINESDVIVGYKNIEFDNPLLRAAEIKIEDRKCYDILKEIQNQIGYKKGTTLNDTVKANFPNAGKNGDGAAAPVLWQQGYHMKVANYCMNDVRITKMLLDRILRFGYIKHPLNPTEILRMRRP